MFTCIFLGPDYYILGCAWSLCVCCMIVISGLATSTPLLIRRMHRHNSDSIAPSARPELAIAVCRFATAHQPSELIGRIHGVSASAISLCHCCNVLIFHEFTNLKVWLCVVEPVFFFLQRETSNSQPFAVWFYP